MSKNLASPKSQKYLYTGLSPTGVLSDKETESIIQLLVTKLKLPSGGAITLRSKLISCSPLQPSVVGLLAIT